MGEMEGEQAQDSCIWMLRLVGLVRLRATLSVTAGGRVEGSLGNGCFASTVAASLPFHWLWTIGAVRQCLQDGQCNRHEIVEKEGAREVRSTRIVASILLWRGYSVPLLAKPEAKHIRVLHTSSVRTNVGEFLSRKSAPLEGLCTCQGACSCAAWNSCSVPLRTNN
jgi:hypothetical protein